MKSYSELIYSWERVEVSLNKRSERAVLLRTDSLSVASLCQFRDKSVQDVNQEIITKAKSRLEDDSLNIVILNLLVDFFFSPCLR